MLLNAQNIKKEYGIQIVLDIEKLEIEDGERIGLIGRNGTGKSTLLGVLAGRIACDEGIIRRNCEIAVMYLEKGKRFHKEVSYRIFSNNFCKYSR